MRRTLTALPLAVALVLLSAAAAWGQGVDAAALLKRTDALMAPTTFEAQVAMEVDRDDGTTRTYEMTLHRRADNTLVLFHAPQIEKGRRILRRGDDMWMILPNVKRPVRVSARQSLMGGDFNNADILRLSLVDDYKATLKKAEGDAAEIDLEARDRGVTYARVVARIQISTGLPIQYDYFTESGKHVKTMKFEGARAMSDGVSRPGVWHMHNLVTGRRSVMRFTDLNSRKALPEAEFTLSGFSQ